MSNFFMLPNFIVGGDTKLTTNEIAVCAVLGRHLRNESGESFPGMTLIAAEAGMSRPTVVASVKSLRAKGTITVRVESTAHKQRFHYRFSETGQAALPVKSETGQAALPVKSETGQAALPVKSETGKNRTTKPVKLLDTNKTINKKEKEELFVLPTWIPQQAWDAWEKMRKAKHKVPTDHARRMAVRKLEEFRSAGHDPAKVLDQSTFHNWTNLYAIKPQDGNSGGAHKAADQATTYQDPYTLYDNLKSAPRRSA
jgi:DNA-binding MarR family transcriptional regulator